MVDIVVLTDASRLRLHAPEILDQLRELGLNAYESGALLTLLSAPQQGLTAQELCRRAKDLGLDVPETKASVSLKQLERLGVAQRHGYPHEYSVSDIRQAVTALGEAKLAELRTQKKGVLDLVENFSTTVSTAIYNTWSEEQQIFPVRGEYAAQELTHEMWRRAENELLIMTNSGHWIVEDPRLRKALKDRPAGGRPKVFALLAHPRFIESPQKRVKNEQARRFFETIDARVFSYEPKSMRMNVVDGSEAELFLWSAGREDHDVPSQILYTAIDSVAKELRDVFLLQCLKSTELGGSYKVAAPKDETLRDDTREIIERLGLPHDE